MKKMMENFEIGGFANVTLEEATKIVEYAVETEVCIRCNVHVNVPLQLVRFFNVQLIYCLTPTLRFNNSSTA